MSLHTVEITFITVYISLLIRGYSVRLSVATPTLSCGRGIKAQPEEPFVGLPPQPAEKATPRAHASICPQTWARDRFKYDE
jgi:hypothetical protein